MFTLSVFSVFLRLFVCTVTDFSAEDKASGIKFCMAVHQIQGRESPISWNFAPLKPKIGLIGQLMKDDECSIW